jgi:hypothetical protein
VGAGVDAGAGSGALDTPDEPNGPAFSASPWLNMNGSNSISAPLNCPELEEAPGELVGPAMSSINGSNSWPSWPGSLGS